MKKKTGIKYRCRLDLVYFRYFSHNIHIKGFRKNIGFDRFPPSLPQYAYDQFLKDLKGNLKLGEILANFAFFRDLITKEDLEETYRTLYFFESH